MVQELYLNNDLYNDLDEVKAVNDLTYFISCKTVSDIDQSKMDFNEFHKIHEYIKNNFPYINKYGVPTVINKGSIYYCIEGKDKDLEALILMGHIDVVPIIKENEWTFEPFGGKVIDGYITGRGAHDMKDIDCAELSSVEYSLAHYGKPERTIYICFGHDEETLGYKGQWEIKNDLKKKNVKVGMVLDEGGSYNDGTEYHAKADLIEVQVMEKGYLDVVIESFNEGGHSSRPGDYTALSEVAKAISRISDIGFPVKLNSSMAEFYKRIAPYVTDENLKELLKNIDTDPDEIAKYLLKDKKLAPYLKTSVAPTMIESDSKGANVLPKYVKAVINLRVSNYDSVDSTFEYIRNLCSDLDVKISKFNSINASLISDTSSKEFKLLDEEIKKFFKVDAVVPTISVGGTDCCFYTELTMNCFRFAPTVDEVELEKGVHGVDEKISVKCYIHAIKAYIDIIKKYCFD